MPSIRVTPEAAAELRNRIDAYSLPNAVVAIFRDIKQADLRRGPQGEVVWTVEHPRAQWRCEVIAMPNKLEVPEFQPWPCFRVDSIGFAIPHHELDTIRAIDIAIIDGTLCVNVRDA